jgi:MioC protein
MDITILYGTESGNSEMLADDIAGELTEFDTNISDLTDIDPADLDAATLYLIVCSTYGDGELPASAQPFAAALTDGAADLTGIRYAIFGLGDSGYESSYGRGSDQLNVLLTGVGAVRVGEFGRHDAAGFDTASDLATAWARTVVGSLTIA